MVKIEIILHDNGNVQVSGSIENKLVAYGLIEAAREAVFKYHESIMNQKIVKPTSSDLSIVRRG